jgi:transposase
MIPKRSGDRVKTNRRDAITLVKLLRAGELNAIWVPDAVHEAVRDLARGRETAIGEKAINELLGSMDGAEYVGPRAPNLPSDAPWMRANLRWLRSIASALG